MAKITLDNLAHSYLPAPTSEADFALKELNHDWEDGAAYALLGSSGCGKSTLLNIISGLLQPSQGRILFDGRDVSALSGASKRAWQSQCAMIFQQFNLVPRMDVVSNVLHGTLNARSTLTTMFNFYPAADIIRAIEILDRPIGRRE